MKPDIVVPGAAPPDAPAAGKARSAPAPAARERDLLVFAHANGFPAPSYRVLLELLGRHYEVRAPDMLGHAPRFPVSDNWPRLLEELAEFVQQHRGGRRVVLVGHSLGGLLGLMLAAAHPDWLRALVLLDSPVVAGWRAGLLWASKRSGLIWRAAPTSLALRRRRVWPDIGAVREHLGAKAPFAGWDPRMLEDYARDGTVDQEGARALRFRPEVEASIYATLPHHLSRLGLRRAGVPIGFIGGTESRELAMAGMRATRRLVGPHLRWMRGGSHLFPFEQPQATAGVILELLRELGA
ncbi:alpha/beta fold hydrolase [Thiomonas sp. FB-6]|uniref:alpha/beta fold hydrolase n=1 Tax=Thiomonas sp. FB-6 TaxID=1158291 RepID=UPI000367CCF5|nr:alpha/beta hydrolase [Thiomonas sp. FB-6]